MDSWDDAFSPSQWQIFETVKQYGVSLRYVNTNNAPLRRKIGIENTEEKDVTF